MNFALFLELHARSKPDEIALVDKRVRMTWRELDEQSNRFANLLEDYGVKPGDRVATYLPNRAELVVAFLGALKFGAVFLPLNARLQGPDLGKVVSHSMPAVLLLMADREEIASETGQSKLIVVDNEDESFWSLLESKSDAHRMVGRQSSDVANLVYTSGTTGMPKAVIHTHGVRVAIAGGMADAFKLSTRDVALIVSPMFHIAGLNVLCNALFSGCKIVVLEKWDLTDFLHILKTESVTYMQMVSTILVDIANAPKELFAKKTTVRFTWGGGHNVDPEVIATYEQRIGGVFLQGWGRTEGGFTYNVLDPERRRFDTHGIGNTNSSEVAIFDHTAGRLADCRQIGEIVVRGDGVSPGYWDGEFVRSKPPLEGEWMQTGDLGFLDEDGQMHFVGRNDHMIKTGGENVYPAEVEAVLLDIPGVSDAVVLGVPDERLGQRVATVVVPGTEISAKAIELACRKTLAGFKIPRKIVFVDALPRLGSQKVDLAACRKLVETATDVHKES